MIREISRTQVCMGERKWAFAEENREDIQRHWAQSQQKNSALWDGKLILCENPEIGAGVLSAQAFEISYSSYLAWRDWGYADRGVFNVFGSALIRSQEGYLVFGIMGAHTAGAGLIYPPAGALERSDAGKDGMLDPIVSALRELKEETGLVVPNKTNREQSDFVSWSGQLISVCSIVQFDRPARDLAEEIRTFLAKDPDPELDDILILKSAKDLNPARTVGYAQIIAQHLLD